MKVYQKAYIAGFIDADGSILLQRNNRNGKVYYYPVVCIYNSHKPVLEKIQSWYNGKLIMELKRPSKKMVKKLYMLRFNNKELKKILKEIYPYLIIKKDTAKVCLDFFKIDKSRRRKNGRLIPMLISKRKKLDNLYIKFKKLQKIGKEPYDKRRKIKRW